MIIVVYYESPDERELAERVVPDVEAIARFAADAIGNQFKSNPVEISAHSEADFARGYSIADLEEPGFHHLGHLDRNGVQQAKLVYVGSTADWYEGVRAGLVRWPERDE